MLTQAVLKKLLTYNPETGDFTRNGVMAGWLMKSGYRQISIRKKKFYAHRLAYLFMTGRWPSAHIDHINMDKSNNKWANLREATRTQNNANRRPFHSTSKYKGVCFDAQTQRWRAQIQINRKHSSLGRFDNEADAATCYNYNAAYLFGEYAQLNVLGQESHD